MPGLPNRQNPFAMIRQAWEDLHLGPTQMTRFQKGSLTCCNRRVQFQYTWCNPLQLQGLLLCCWCDGHHHIHQSLSWATWFPWLRWEASEGEWHESCSGQKVAPLNTVGFNGFHGESLERKSSWTSESYLFFYATTFFHRSDLCFISIRVVDLCKNFCINEWTMDLCLSTPNSKWKPHSRGWDVSSTLLIPTWMDTSHRWQWLA